jgi:hypothetical protein
MGNRRKSRIQLVLNASALFLRGKKTRIDLANGSANMGFNLSADLKLVEIG